MVTSVIKERKNSSKGTFSGYNLGEGQERIECLYQEKREGRHINLFKQSIILP